MSDLPTLRKYSTQSGINKSNILEDYKVCVQSREASLLGRKEVFMGKAKFGIFGDGKEVAQVCMARAFRDGDIRSGYYRDQTFMFAIEQTTIQQFFAQLYAHTDVKHDPSSGGRLMNSHFATRFLNDRGEWKTLTDIKNSTSDVSCTAGQIARLIGLGYASKLYRNNKGLSQYQDFSINGNEIAFGTIGNAATAEGHFFEAVNAAGVLQIPVIFSVWDDYYGISVPNEYQITKSEISEALGGFQRSEEQQGVEILKVKGWDYESLFESYQYAARLGREQHIPSVIHVTEMTQPQGHSSSGSHERYKSKERLKWEAAHDCNLKFRNWILSNGYAGEDELLKLETEACDVVKDARNKAWNAYKSSLSTFFTEGKKLVSDLALESKHSSGIKKLLEEFEIVLNPWKSDLVKIIRKSLRLTRYEKAQSRSRLKSWLHEMEKNWEKEYSSLLYSNSKLAAIGIKEVAPLYDENADLVDGREVLNAGFDELFESNPLIFAIGEDVGKIGDVNQGMAGLQDKFGELRVTDTGIRETTIVGQGVGSALRGLRPIVEIQYLDYIYYALETLTDDLACLRYRTKGGQKAPVIIRTRGHRLEGVWHSGSPMATLLGSVRGIYLLVPRNMTRAIGFYNTMLDSDDPAIVIETLNAYRKKERMPSNLRSLRTPLGVPEVIREGSDVTIVTYGAMCPIVMESADQLAEIGVEVEVIDAQTLIPFDLNGVILDSLKKTNRIIFADEDVPGGATAYMMQKVIDEQKGYQYLDSRPLAISAKEHRPAYSTDGDYFSKPNVEEVFDVVYGMMSEVDPAQFPPVY